MDPNEVAAQGIWAFLLSMIVAMAIIGPILYVITSWFMMKLFEKAGVQGAWRAWVPIYREMIFLKLGDVSPWLLLYALGATMLLSWTGIGAIVGFAITAVMVMAAWRVGLKLQKEGAWAVLYFFLGIVWHGIVAFDSSRWNTNVPPAPWAGNGFLADRTVWSGIPVQSASIAPGYGAPQQPGYGAPQGYAAPQQGYAPPAQPYGDPAQQHGYPQPPAYGAPQDPYTAPPAPPAYGAPPAHGVPPVPDAPQPPAAPGEPPAAPSAPDVPPAPGTHPNQPPA